MRLVLLLNNLEEQVFSICIEVKGCLVQIRFKHKLADVYLKGKVFNVLLHRRVAPCAADHPLGVKDGVLGVGGQLVLRSVSDETLTFGGEGHV